MRNILSLEGVTNKSFGAHSKNNGSFLNALKLNEAKAALACDGCAN
jgi:hypothetical protein